MSMTKPVTQMDAGELREHLAERLASGFCGWDERRRLALILAHLTGLTTAEILDIAYADAADVLAAQ